MYGNFFIGVSRNENVNYHDDDHAHKLKKARRHSGKGNGYPAPVLSKTYWTKKNHGIKERHVF
jgi:hypothetical protein